MNLVQGLSQSHQRILVNAYRDHSSRAFGQVRYMNHLVGLGLLSETLKDGVSTWALTETAKPLIKAQLIKPVSETKGVVWELKLCIWCEVFHTSCKDCKWIKLPGHQIGYDYKVSRRDAQGNDHTVLIKIPEGQWGNLAYSGAALHLHEKYKAEGYMTSVDALHGRASGIIK